MKLNISNKNTSNDIQAKVGKILALNNDNNETKGNNKLKLNISNKTETNKPKLTLNKSKSVMESNNNITLEKLDRIDQLSNKIFDLDNSFNTFLTNQNESISVLNGFNSKIDNIEILIMNSIKNQKSILDGINSFHSILMNLNNSVKTETDKTETDKPIETKLRKGNETNKTETIDNDNPEMIYKAFMDIFKGNFNYTKELIHLDLFIPFIESIDFDSIELITKSYETYFSKYLKANDNKQLIARKSKSNAINSLLELGKKLGIEINEKLDNTQINSIPIDKSYFSNLFGIDINTINELIAESKTYGSIDNDLIESIKSYLIAFKPNLNDNELGLFIKYIKSYIE